MGVRTWCLFCNDSAVSTYMTVSIYSLISTIWIALNGLDLCSYLEVLDGLEVLDVGLEVLDGGLKVLDGGLEVYDQLLPNGLADPLGMELLEL